LFSHWSRPSGNCACGPSQGSRTSTSANLIMKKVNERQREGKEPRNAQLAHAYPVLSSRPCKATLSSAITSVLVVKKHLPSRSRVLPLLQERTNSRKVELFPCLLLDWCSFRSLPVWQSWEWPITGENSVSDSPSAAVFRNSLLRTRENSDLASPPALVSDVSTKRESSLL